MLIKSIHKYCQTVDGIKVTTMQDVRIYTLQFWATEKTKQGAALDISAFDDNFYTIYMGCIYELAKKKKARRSLICGQNLSFIKDTVFIGYEKQIMNCLGSKRNKAPACGGCSDLDLHAGTCVFSSAYQVLELVGPTCGVYLYLAVYMPIKNVPVITTATAYDRINCETFILIVNQALSIPDQQPNLLCPNQLRLHRVEGALRWQFNQAGFFSVDGSQSNTC
jgi:hypothetical protein